MEVLKPVSVAEHVLIGLRRREGAQWARRR